MLYYVCFIADTIEVTEGRNYFPRVPHVGSPDLGKFSKEGRVRNILQRHKSMNSKKRKHLEDNLRKCA
jgi:hypothetical protein